MITGFNTDVDFNGRVYHVQTEDRGVKNPVVESLVYSGGEIITSRKSCYAELITSRSYTEDGVLRRMEAQHRELIREIRNGRFGRDELRPFGHAIVTNRSFDEVVLAFLRETTGPERLRLELGAPEGAADGARQILRLRLVEEPTGKPVAAAAVSVLWFGSGDLAERVLFRGATDREGRLDATVQFPGADATGATIVCRAEAAGRTVELKRTVRRAAVSANRS
jgi:hypothetical protein